MSVFKYLNDKANKQFKASAKPTARFVKGRFSEGYTLSDYTMVIDTRASNWLDDPHWQKYLCPSTLFNARNFENYCVSTWYPTPRIF
ncbi:MAG: conserved phage C-terminal domain-containing protein [Sporosarcina sp.]